MPISLYDASVRCFVQTLGAVSEFLEVGRSHCTENNVDPNEMVEAQLFQDMRPLHYQVQAVATHSIGAIEGAKRGQVSPMMPGPVVPYASLQKLVAETIERLQAVTPEEVNALEGRDVVFTVPERGLTLPFLVQDYFLSFALPNFHFHATTAYDILRMKGVPVGKRHYMGQMRIKA